MLQLWPTEEPSLDWNLKFLSWGRVIFKLRADKGRPECRRTSVVVRQVHAISNCSLTMINVPFVQCCFCGCARLHRRMRAVFIHSCGWPLLVSRPSPGKSVTVQCSCFAPLCNTHNAVLCAPGVLGEMSIKGYWESEKKNTKWLSGHMTFVVHFEMHYWLQAFFERPWNECDTDTAQSSGVDCCASIPLRCFIRGPKMLPRAVS